MRKYILLFAAAFIIIAGVSWVTNEPSNDTKTPASETAAADMVPEDWQQYEHARFDFRIAYPPIASVQSEGPQNRHIKFTYLGPDNATGEITDGFTLTVSTYRLDDGQSVQAFAQSKARQQPAGSPTTHVSTTSLAGQTSYRYTTESLGTITHLATKHTDNRAVVVSYNISDPNDNNYQSLVETMLSSLQLKSVASNAADSGKVDSIELALLDTKLDSGESPDAGCDKIARVSRDITPTQAPLTAALEELFALERTQVQEFYNFIAKTNDTLKFNKARVGPDGTAHIYLRGRLSGLEGVCDNPRARVQITQTAVQFPTVETVKLYRNGNPTDLRPSNR